MCHPKIYVEVLIHIIPQNVKLGNRVVADVNWLRKVI